VEGAIPAALAFTRTVPSVIGCEAGQALHFHHPELSDESNPRAGDLGQLKGTRPSEFVVSIDDLFDFLSSRLSIHAM